VVRVAISPRHAWEAVSRPPKRQGHGRNGEDVRPPLQHVGRNARRQLGEERLRVERLRRRQVRRRRLPDEQDVGVLRLRALLERGTG
jgi:hypothetical protein